MRVLLINTSERIGGAAVACHRLMDALESNGVKAKMLVRDKQTDRSSVVALKGFKWMQVWRFVWERFRIWAANGFGNRKNLFTVDIANTGTDVTSLPEFKEADIIHLHWINQGMLSLGGIRRILESGKPVVWTMHDMWPCTGICHHAHTCNRFKTECKQCPFLRFPKDNDLANKVFKKKKALFGERDINVVAVSNWLKKQVDDSALLGHSSVSVIPNTLSLDNFQIMDRSESRTKLSLPQDKHIILFGAARVDDPIKGFAILLDAISNLIDRGVYKAEELHLVTFGKYKNAQAFADRIPVSYTDIGWLDDSSILSMLYSAADITVSSSLYETFGQTLIEAQACGCIPVSFGEGGQTDIIRHKSNGFIADYLSVESLAEGMAWGISEGAKIEKKELRDEVLQRYSGEVVARQYIDLYNKIIRENGK